MVGTSPNSGHTASPLRGYAQIPRYVQDFVCPRPLGVIALRD
jgi:hypothetical protein